jgi:hypothetical protein
MAKCSFTRRRKEARLRSVGIVFLHQEHENIKPQTIKKPRKCRVE